MKKKINAVLSGIPETLLWTLHNRANEAKRPDGIIKDNKAIEIYESIDYNYTRSFGKPEPSHAVRSITFDREVERFIDEYPQGIIVNLGEGLETQRFRVRNNSNLWYSLDVPEAIAVRELFIQPDERHRHLSMSVLDKEWFKRIPNEVPVLLTAQGLLMYFEQEKVKWLINGISSRFEHAVFLFDTIPEWFSRKTIKGMKKTRHYTTPKMPWGINRDKIEDTLLDWESHITEIRQIPYQFPRGGNKIFIAVANRIPVLGNMLPSMVKLTIKSRS